MGEIAITNAIPQSKNMEGQRELLDKIDLKGLWIKSLEDQKGTQDSVIPGQ